MPIYPPHFRRWGDYHVGPMLPPANSCDRKVVVVIFVVALEIFERVAEAVTFSLASTRLLCG